jgi:hypothetical protein
MQREWEAEELRRKFEERKPKAESQFSRPKSSSRELVRAKASLICPEHFDS